jgi:hypothetical protein
MWSKNPKPGGKGLRCKIQVQRGGELVPCDRPARRYRQMVMAFWDDSQPLDVGVIDCCINHAIKLERQGVTLKKIDRRKTANDGIPDS